jgi:hypothetical protein
MDDQGDKMSDQGSNAPAPESSAPIQESSAPINGDSELEALEQEFDGQESSTKEASSSSKEAPKSEVKAADKAAKQEGAKKVSDDKYKIKVDGEDIELSRDELVKYAQMGRAGQKKMQEAAQVRQEAIHLVEMLRSNPRAVLSDPAILGSEEAVLKFAQEILANKFEEEQKDPSVLRAEKAEKELEELRKEKKTSEERRQQEEYQRMVQQEEAQLENQITDAFESSGLPKSPFVLKRLADVMISAAESDKNITPKMALNIVKREMQKDLKEYFDMTPEDALEELLNADKVKNLRKRQLSKLKASASAAAPSLSEIRESAKPLEKTEEAPKKTSMRDFLRR